MIRLSNEGIVLPLIGSFGPCVVSVGYYGGVVNTGKAKEVAGMSAKERDKAAAWVHKTLVGWGLDAGRTVADIRKQYFSEVING